MKTPNNEILPPACRKAAYCASSRYYVNGSHFMVPYKKGRIRTLHHWGYTRLRFSDFHRRLVLCSFWKTSHAVGNTQNVGRGRNPRKRPFLKHSDNIFLQS